ncbi:MAG TPA: response regulator [Abditibacteriaceae bacterium]|jgi:diguanylate cyclase (GGDEF)-like protein
MFRDRILIIDDEPDTIQILRFALERAGFEVAVAGSGENMLEVAQSSAPDLILLDLTLDSQNGLDVCRNLRRNTQTRHLPIILVTGKLRTEFDTVEGFKAGADDYIMKPFRPAEVVARVCGILDRARRHRDASPLTGLPGNVPFQAELTRQLTAAREGQKFGVLFADLDQFQIYNDLYGFESGDKILKTLGEKLGEIAVATHAESFVAHTGADDFVVVTEPRHMEEIALQLIREFDAARPEWYPAEIVERGHLLVRDRRGQETTYPLLSLSVVGVSNEVREFRNPLEIAAVAAETRKAVKNMAGSNYLKDRRSGLSRTLEICS